MHTDEYLYIPMITFLSWDHRVTAACEQKDRSISRFLVFRIWPEPYPNPAPFNLGTSLSTRNTVYFLINNDTIMALRLSAEMIFGEKCEKIHEKRASSARARTFRKISFVPRRRPSSLSLKHPYIYILKKTTEI